MGIDVASTDVSLRLSESEASWRLNRLGASNTCRCKTDFQKVAHVHAGG
jgi:hypothetical protein